MPFPTYLLSFVWPSLSPAKPQFTLGDLAKPSPSSPERVLLPIYVCLSQRCHYCPVHTGFCPLGAPTSQPVQSGLIRGWWSWEAEMHWLGWLPAAPLRASVCGRVLLEQRTCAHSTAVPEAALGGATLLPSQCTEIDGASAKSS